MVCAYRSYSKEEYRAAVAIRLDYGDLRVYRPSEASLAEIELSERVVFAIDEESNDYDTDWERAGVVSDKAWLAFVRRHRGMFYRTGLLEGMAS